jgi:molybdate transport system ATP-binding protein
MAGTAGAPPGLGAVVIDFEAFIDRGGFRLDCRFASDSQALALFGRSGAGKSTVLAILAGLLKPDRGRVVVDGEVLLDVERGHFVPAHRRRIGMVFQDALLFPHLDVRGNLRYGLSAASAGPASLFGDVVSMLGIAHLLERRPGSLSGGERQRVAIGRALLSQPRLLLLDEPLSALDIERRAEIMPYIERLRDEARCPLVYVSHAIDEVARIAREVLVLDEGRVMASGPPGEVLAPIRTYRGAGGAGGAVAEEDEGADRADRAGLAGASTADFAPVSVIEAIVQAHDTAYGLTVLSHPAGSMSVPGMIGKVGATARLLVRATDIALALQRPQAVSFRTVLVGAVSDIGRDAGPIGRVEIALRGQGRLVALVTRQAIDELRLQPGSEVFAMVKASAMDERSIASRLASR